jgi:hypothetical protein
MSLLAIGQWLERSSLGTGIMVRKVATLDLRLVGRGILGVQPVYRVAGQFFPWTCTGFEFHG